MICGKELRQVFTSRSCSDLTFHMMCCGAVIQGAKSITSFEILPEPPEQRDETNPWPQWPRVFKVDYGHEEVKIRMGKDPRIFSVLSKVSFSEIHLGPHTFRLMVRPHPKCVLSHLGL